MRLPLGAASLLCVLCALAGLALLAEGRLAWTMIPPTSSSAPWPAPRRSHSMVMDSTQIVLFGGRANNSMPLNDVWTYNLRTGNWTRVYAHKSDLLMPVGRPAARYGHSAVLYQGRMYVYGGNSYFCTDFCDDVWVYDLGTRLWSEMPQNATAKRPTRRWLHSAVVVGKSMLVFAGHCTNKKFFGDLWAMDFANGTWTEVKPVNQAEVASRLPRMAAAVAYDARDGLLFVHGGYRQTSSPYWLDDMWVYDVANRTWGEVIPDSAVKPGGRWAHGAALYKDHFYIFGGRDDQYNVRRDVWQFNISSFMWASSNVSSFGIPPRARSHMAVQVFSDALVVWGGTATADNFTDYLNDFWRYDFNACPNDCSNAGICYKGFCACNVGAYGYDCSLKTCPAGICEYRYDTHVQTCLQCSPPRGVCNGKEGKCVCDYGTFRASGSDCSLTLCMNDCTPSRRTIAREYGDDVADAIIADLRNTDGVPPGWSFAKQGLFANGRCNTTVGSCACERGFDGEDCSIQGGCMMFIASNYDPDAIYDNGSCIIRSDLRIPTLNFTLTFNNSYEDTITSKPFLRSIEPRLTKYMNLTFERMSTTKVARGSVVVTYQLYDPPLRMREDGVEEQVSFQDVDKVMSRTEALNGQLSALATLQLIEILGQQKPLPKFDLGSDLVVTKVDTLGNLNEANLAALGYTKDDLAAAKKAANNVLYPPPPSKSGVNLLFLFSIVWALAIYL